MSRILKGAGSTITATFYIDEGDIDSTTDVTIEVLRENGDVLVPSGTATNAGAAADGTYSFTLDPSLTARVDVLTARWTATIGGEEMTLETQEEIVGGFYFTIAAARASSSDLVSTTKYTVEQLAEARDEVEDECETITKVAWVERYRHVTLSGTGHPRIVLPDNKPREIFSLTVGGVAFTSDELADLYLDPWGVLARRNGCFPRGIGNIDVIYAHGYDRPLSDIRRAALIRLKNLLFADKSGIPDRAVSFVAGPGGNFTLATAGKGSSETGIPDVDAAYGRHPHNRPVFA